jgi:hypothetical protein
MWRLTSDVMVESAEAGACGIMITEEDAKELSDWLLASATAILREKDQMSEYGQ